MKAAELDRKIENAAKKGYKATKQLYKKIIRRIRGNDVRYFNTTKRGDINDWRKQLHGLNKKEVGRTMKCVIAAMTIGTDVSSLFPDVISCIHNETLELKKLVYLYLLKYARENPELTLLSVNTFVQDCEDKNPLIRSLALRTMGCLRVQSVIEYLVPLLDKALNDVDPYVRKTAAVCVAKLYDMAPERCEEEGFILRLRKMINDTSPFVVSNAIYALHDISQTIGRDCIGVNSKMLNRLLLCLEECSEWGQIIILDVIASYVPQDEAEAIIIVEKTLPRLQHANVGVVMGAIKVILLNVEDCDEELTRAALNKLAHALVSLTSVESAELRYVVLRSMRLIVQKVPNLLSQNIQVFFCKYNDPYYVKMEKLELLISLATPKYIERVLSELKEYATQADVSFVRASVRAIGRCAIKLESAADRCVNVLLFLLQSKVSYIVQEAIVVLTRLFRLYPGKYTSVIVPMCGVIDLLDEAEARACIIWVIGEYSNVIDSAGELLGLFLDSYHDEKPVVQLQLLTAAVKLFLRRPDAGKDVMTSLLTVATAETLSVDMRDRAYLYWRLLSSNPAAARRVVLGEHPPLKHEYKEEMDDDTLYTMLEQMGSVAGVFFKAPETFITPSRGPAPIGTMSPLADEDIESVEENEEDESSEDSDEDIDIFADEDEKKEEPKEEEEPKSDDSFDDIFK
ncbi:adaptor protein complex 1 or 2, subunit beta 5 [Blastocystis sp. ATCC 50177/Nand II]|uniref:AP complex subunit beta n=1 Tax=Blastocystis sp. subtype 1 (strain ATCC 50177 / NandII) TaxID=478820 RepID=A0A196S949_BLAHN|nr:adaptor protein complex 1 or 2, subunit beta 5 [Blastocystis sp. ATCC 50177/Nand II]